MNAAAVMTVDGTPAPQGSKVAFAAGNRIVMLEGHAKGRAALNIWRTAVAARAIKYRSEQGVDLFDGPLKVSLVFRLTRPASVSQKSRRYPHVRPDVDKLTRAVLDALTNTLIADDSRVVDLHAYKRYARVAEPPGVTLAVEEMR